MQYQQQWPWLAAPMWAGVCGAGSRGVLEWGKPPNDAKNVLCAPELPPGSPQGPAWLWPLASPNPTQRLIQRAGLAALMRAGGVRERPWGIFRGR